jgi:hypothetical protein
MQVALESGIVEYVQNAKTFVGESLKNAIPLDHALAQAQHVVAKNQQLSEILQESIGKTQGIITGLTHVTANGKR